MRLRLLPVALLPAVAALSETPMHAGRIAHDLDRLAGTARVLYVAAHPDDENTRLLAWLANGRHVRAAYLSMTRGGGGQNLVGGEQGELLDVIRTQELLSARSVDGAEQIFTRMRDFGYSKTAEETFAIWGHEEALSDVVRVVRTFRPDVIVARFDEKPPNHGHHTASAILAREAFAAAADPARFPEHDLKPWKAHRLLWNVSPWREGPPPEGAFGLDVGAWDPRLGVSYGELAALSRSRHASQGFGVAGERGPLTERFLVLAGAPASSDLLEGVETSWSRYGEDGRAVDAAFAEARALLDRDAPERAVPALLRAHDALALLPGDDVRVRDARGDLDALVAACAGLFVRATAPSATVTPGSSLKVDVETVLRTGADLTLRRVTLPGGAVIVPKDALGPHVRRVISQEITVPSGMAVSAPYWLARPSEPGRQVVEDAALIGEPEGPAALRAELELEASGRTLVLTTPLVHAWVDPVRGERTRPVLVVPPATLTPAREAFLLPNGSGAGVELRVKAGRDGLKGRVSLPLPPGWSARPPWHDVSLASAGEERTLRFDVAAPAAADAIEVAPVLAVDGREWSWRETLVDHAHLPIQLVLQPSSLRLVPLRIELPEGLVGYVEGSGDTVAEDLAHAGLRVETVDAATLRGGDLSRYAAIVLGIRSHNTRPDVRAAQPRLDAYVEGGGVLVVQYLTNNRLAPLKTAIGPYPLEIGRDRVTDERAAMTPVRADHPLLAAPNRITDADFEGWVQERGIYFASTWDERYESLFSAADPGEKPLTGGTLVARHGKGRYVYTGLAFFRQLPAGVPGAYRLFANLLSPVTR